MVLQKGAVRRVKEGTSAVLLQSGLIESLVGRFYGMLHLSAKTSQIYHLMGRRPMKDVLGNHFKGPFFVPFGSLVWVSSYNCEGSVTHPSIWKESFTWIVPRICFVRGVNLERWRTDRRPWGVRNDGRIGNLLEKTQLERGDISQTSNRRWTNQNPGGDQELRTSTLIRHRPIQGE